MMVRMYKYMGVYGLWYLKITIFCALRIIIRDDVDLFFAQTKIA